VDEVIGIAHDDDEKRRSPRRLSTITLGPRPKRGAAARTTRNGGLLFIAEKAGIDAW
jgi:hypothetical protein